MDQRIKELERKTPSNREVTQKPGKENIPAYNVHADNMSTNAIADVCFLCNFYVYMFSVIQCYYWLSLTCSKAARFLSTFNASLNTKYVGWQYATYM